MTKFNVVERFVSVNGEGNFAGHLAVFIRFFGCNLSCRYCDTLWASDEKTPCEFLTKQDILDYVKNTGVLKVTLTGGEPLLQEGVFELLESLAKIENLSVEIETNGSVCIQKFTEIKNRPNFTLDYKLPTSGVQSQMKVENYKYLTFQDCVKFVVGSLSDLLVFKEVMDKYKLRERTNVHLSQAYGEIELEKIVDFMKKHTINGVRLQPQIHKFIWEPNRKGV